MANASLNSFVHIFTPGSSAKTLVLLHGTGGDEHDLKPIADQIAPDFKVLSLRGNEPEHGMNRFFRRFVEGHFDEDNIKKHATELEHFLSAAAAEYHFDLHQACFLGYSNGANFAAAFMLLYPGIVKQAILLRAMIPLEPDPLPDLTDTSILIESGKHDQMLSSEGTKRLGELLLQCHAEVTHNWQDAGHGLTQKDLEEARDWLLS